MASERDYAKVRPLIAKMERRLVVVAHCGSVPRRHLHDAMQGIRAALPRWRRGARGVGRVVGAIHPHWDHRGFWDVHAHLLFDVDDAFNFDQAASLWRDITAGRGTLSVEADPSLKCPDGWAHYVMRPGDWCPVPGDMSVDLLRELRAAMRCRHRVVAWGFERKASRRRPSKPSSISAVAAISPGDHS